MLQNTPQVATAYGKLKARLDNMCRQSGLLNDSLSTGTKPTHIHSIRTSPIDTTDTVTSNANLSALTTPSTTFEPSSSAKDTRSLGALSQTPTADTGYETDGTGASGYTNNSGSTVVNPHFC